VPTEQEVSEALACDVNGLATGKFAGGVGIPEDPCEWAALSVAESTDSVGHYYGTAPPAGEGALTEALLGNPAYALTTPVFYAFYATHVTQAPPLATQEIVELQLSYAWSGYGRSTYWDVGFVDSNSEPEGAGTVRENPWAGTVSAETVQALAAALVDLHATDTYATIQPCWDSYPEWQISLLFADGTVVDLVTQGSNVYDLGGPWQLTIDGQRYLQYTDPLVAAVWELVTEAGLPLGEPFIWGCGYLSPSMLELTWPEP